MCELNTLPEMCTSCEVLMTSSARPKILNEFTMQIIRHAAYPPHLLFCFFSHTTPFQLLDKPWSQVSFLLPPRFLPSDFIARRVQQSHCSSIFHRVLLTPALAFSASQFVRKKKSPRIYTSMPSVGFELTKLTYTRLEDNLIRHRGDRLHTPRSPVAHRRAQTRG